VGIGIYETSQKNKDGIAVAFFGCDDALLLKALYAHASKIAGPGLEQYNPKAGERVRKVGEIQIVAVADDAQFYVVAADEEAEKPEGGRTPSGSNGTWAVQSLIFSKDIFSLAEAKTWIQEHSGFGDYGYDETETSFRFRQYDPEHFSEFKTISVTEGISAAYGKISKEVESEEESNKALAQSIALWEAVHNVNKGIMNSGLKVLSDTAVIRKAEDGSEEERFVLSLVLEPNDGGNDAPLKPDTQKDIYSEEEVRKAAHTWMEHHGAVDLNHSWKSLGKEKVRTLESYLAPVTFKCGKPEDEKAYEVVKGTWMLGLRIVDDDLWTAIKAGEIGAYSIGGVATREPVE